MTAVSAPRTATLARVRAARPLVHCLTNDVTAGRVADALAAVGALPVLAWAVEEVREIALSADALLLNCGTPRPARWDAMREAAEIASERGIPVVLDPVGAAASRWRLANARALLGIARPIVRGNVPEVSALAGLDPAGRERGVTALDVGPDAALEVAAAAARALGTTVLVSGPVDAVADRDRQRSAPRGDTSVDVVGLGDVLGALVAATAWVEPDALEAAWAARASVHDAACRAIETGAGAGSFWPAFIDALGSGA